MTRSHRRIQRFCILPVALRIWSPRTDHRNAALSQRRDLVSRCWRAARPRSVGRRFPPAIYGGVRL